MLSYPLTILSPPLFLPSSLLSHNPVPSSSLLSPNPFLSLSPLLNFSQSCSFSHSPLHFHHPVISVFFFFCTITLTLFTPHNCLFSLSHNPILYLFHLTIFCLLFTLPQFCSLSFYLPTQFYVIFTTIPVSSPSL